MAFIRCFVPKPPAVRDTMMLATKHPHPRDEIVLFDEPTHKYFVYHKESSTYNQLCGSVSGLYKHFFNEFDSETISKSTAKKHKRMKSSPYYWLLQTCENDEEGAAAIKNAWETVGNRASSFGTKAHLQMELYLNGVLKSDDPELTPHSKLAIKWVDGKVNALGWVPYRTEWSIFIDMTNPKVCDGSLFKNHRYLLAGQLDSLFYTDAGDGTRKWIMADWKFCGNGKLDPESGSFRGSVPKGNGPLSGIPDNSYGHYQVQQSLYAYILKKRYDIVVSDSYLVHIPTDEDEGGGPPFAFEIKLTLLPDEIIESMFASYITSLGTHNTMV